MESTREEPKKPSTSESITVTQETTPIEEGVDQVLGRYKLLEKLGEGGFGAVWLAEQKEPVRRKVALKIIKLGMDTKAVVARFEAERQALAMMDHPNIAKVLDAGATAQGRPFFVMELVRGIRITDYCEQNNLSTRERLDLFIKVCQAIQHAHQKGIIHRDIKPSNILVTLHDGIPVPKVIDFGIAKATQGELTDKTVHTQFQQFIGTPAYMSPEQAEMSGLDIDTRSDIYSLGVLLYELLTGSTPFDAKHLMSQGLDAMRKTIREKEPPKPSTKLSQTLIAADLTRPQSPSSDQPSSEEEVQASARRMLRVKETIALLRGDLDWVVMKCLEKDRTRRYETANGLATDIGRHLNQEPVAARPPSTVYRLQKTFQRNKLIFAAGTAIVAALITGLALAAAGWRRASLERNSAITARANEEDRRREAQQAQANEAVLRRQAEAQALANRQQAYAADMNLAQQALAVNNLGRAQSLLDSQRPAAGQTDLRGWEWRYLWSQTRPDDHEVFSRKPTIPRAVAFSADGQLLVTESEGVTTVSDFVSRRTVFEQTNCRSPVFARHSPLLAGLQQGSNANTIVFWEPIDHREVGRVPTGGGARLLGFSNDDRHLLALSARLVSSPTELPVELTAWDVAGLKPAWHRPLRSLGSGVGQPYAFSPDGKSFAIGNFSLGTGAVQVIELKDGTDRLSFVASQERPTAIAFSPDNSLLLTGAGYTDSVIRLWDAGTAESKGSLEGHRSWISALVFSPDGKLLFSSSADQTIRLWDWAQRNAAGIMRGHASEVQGIAISPDGRTLASRCKDGAVYLWNPGERPARSPHQKLPLRVYEAAIPPGRPSILAVAIDGGIIEWDLASLREIRRWPTKGRDSALSTHLSGAGSQAVTFELDGFLTVLDLATGTAQTNVLRGAPVSICQFTPDGKFLVTMLRSGGVGADRQFLVQAWDSSTWTLRSSFAAKSLYNLTLPEVPGRIVLETEGKLQILDVNQTSMKPLELRASNGLYGMEISPNGRLAAGAYESGTVQLWDLLTLKPTVALRDFLLGAHSVAFSQDGKRLAAGSNGAEAVKLWDTDRWQELLTLPGEGSMFTWTRFSADGRYLVAMNSSGLVHLWSAPSMEEIATTETREATERR